MLYSELFILGKAEFKTVNADPVAGYAYFFRCIVQNMYAGVIQSLCQAGIFIRGKDMELRFMIPVRKINRCNFRKSADHRKGCFLRELSFSYYNVP
jgi:hypothetical protein